MNELLTSCKMTTKLEAARWVRLATKEFAGAFHPDNPAADYVNSETNLPTFTHQEQKNFDRRRARAFERLGDKVYEIGCAQLKRMGLVGGVA